MRLVTLVASVPFLLCAASCGRSPAIETSPTAVVAEPPPAAKTHTMPPAVTDYLTALAAVEQAKAPVSLEPLFAKAEAVQTVLMEVVDEKAALERYTDAEFAGLQTEVRGLKLNRGLDIYAQPEPAFFLALAKAHGLPEDVAFFEQYSAAWGADLVPVFLKLRPQPTPCVRFGENLITPLYGSWQDYSAKHPDSYTALVAQGLSDLEETVALGTCACDGLESVRSEQAEFLKRFPTAPKAAVIKARREQLVTAPDVLPVNCR